MKWACVLLVLCAGCGLEEGVRHDMERAYFEGQRDAIDGDVRIKWDDDAKCWRWQKTPWDDGTATTFDPSSSGTK